MRAEDRADVATIVREAGNFSQAEISCAMELVDIYLCNSDQKDYHVVVATGPDGRVCGYACWGPTPLTRGAFDLYWIATHPDVRGSGLGSRLLADVESRVSEQKGRLLVIETSSKESYGNTVGFYRRSGYEEASRIRDFYDVGDDKLVFVKRFPR
jgi:ribosomal protein S18 acetylase RimI-like enzyme